MSFFLEETAYSLKELAECLIGRGFWGGKGNPLTKGEGLGFELAAGFAFDEQEFAHMWKVRLGPGNARVLAAVPDSTGDAWEHSENKPHQRILARVEEW